VDGVLARGQRPQKQIIPCIDAWAQEQFWDNVFAKTKDVVLRQLHIKEGGLLKILQGIVDRDAIDFRQQYEIMTRHYLRAEEFFSSCLWRVVQECPVECINEREEQRCPRGPGARPLHRAVPKGASEKPHPTRLAFGAVFSRGIQDWVDAGRRLKSPLPPHSGPCTICLAIRAQSFCFSYPLGYGLWRQRAALSRYYSTPPTPDVAQQQLKGWDESQNHLPVRPAFCKLGGAHLNIAEDAAQGPDFEGATATHRDRRPQMRPGEDMMTPTCAHDGEPLRL